MSDFAALDEALQGLILQVSPASRHMLARQIAAALRRKNQQRIAAQQNPDGSTYAPRKKKPHRKKGSIRSGMFRKLRTNKYIKLDASREAAIVYIIEDMQRLARVHHYGLRDRVSPGGPEHHYQRRQLLGIPDDDIELVRDIVINHLAR